MPPGSKPWDSNKHKPWAPKQLLPQKLHPSLLEISINPTASSQCRISNNLGKEPGICLAGTVMIQGISASKEGQRGGLPTSTSNHTPDEGVHLRFGRRTRCPSLWQTYPRPAKIRKEETVGWSLWELWVSQGGLRQGSRAAKKDLKIGPLDLSSWQPKQAQFTWVHSWKLLLWIDLLSCYSLILVYTWIYKYVYENMGMETFTINSCQVSDTWNFEYCKVAFSLPR